MEAREWGRWWRLVGHDDLLDLLSVEWDPIGFGGLLPHDEYECATGPVATVLRAGGDATEVAAALSRQRIGHFGLDADAESDRSAAEAIVAWYQAATAPRVDSPGVVNGSTVVVDYFGLEVIADVAVRGWRIGFFTPTFEEDDPRSGDAYLVAPDGRCCSVAWIVDEPRLIKVQPGPRGESRFAFVSVVLDYGPLDPERAERFIRDLLPAVEPIWMA